jgi:hypothetical protein
MTTPAEPQIVKVPLETWNMYADRLAVLDRITTEFSGRRRMDVRAESERIVLSIADILTAARLMV